MNHAKETAQDEIIHYSERNRPSSPNALSTSLTFGWRALLKIKYDPSQLIDVTAFPIIFLLMFTYLFGGALSGSTSEYLEFLVPGVLVMSVTMITMYTGIDLSNDISKGVIDRFRTLPIWHPSALVGSLIVDSLRYTLASTIIIVLGMVLGFRPDSGILGVLLGVALLLVFCFSLSWIWTTLGLILQSEKTIMSTSMMLLFPLSFASNIFVDPKTMPNWIQSIVEVNPITILVTAVRGSMEGNVTFEQVGLVILISAILTAIFAPITMYLYRLK